MDSPRIFKIVTPQQKAAEKRNRLARHLAIGLAILALISSACYFFGCRGSSGTNLAHPGVWPASSELAPNPDCPTIVLLVNPEAKDAAPQLNELYRRLCECKLSAVVILNQEQKSDPMLDAARRLPNTTIIPPDDKNAQSFQLNQSGQCLIYDPNGRLRFEGNLTTDVNHRDRTELEYVLAGFHRPAMRSSESNNGANAQVE